MDQFIFLLLFLLCYGPIYISKSIKQFRKNRRIIIIRKKDVIYIILQSSLLLVILWILLSEFNYQK